MDRIRESELMEEETQVRAYSVKIASDRHVVIGGYMP